MREMTKETVQSQEADSKYKFSYRLGRRVLAAGMAGVLVGSMALGWAIQIRDLHNQYVGSAMEYASQVVRDNTDYMNQPAIERAWRVLNNAIGKPKTYEEFETYASLSIARGEYGDGIDYLQKCIDLYAGEPGRELAMLWLRKGSLYTLTEDYESAAACFDRTLSLDDSLADAYLLRAQMKSEMGQNEAAAEDLRTYEAMAGSHPVIQAALGGLYESVENYASAVECYSLAIESGKYDVDNLASRGRCRILTEDSEGALLDLERFFREGGKDTSGDIFAMLGMCRMDAEDYEGAIKAFHSAIQMDYSDKRLLLNQCVICGYVSGDYETVISDGNRAMELGVQEGASGKELGELNQWIGSAHFIRQESEEAAAAFENAVRYDPELPQMNYYAGICNMSIGENEKAAAYFEESARRGEYASICLYDSALCYVQLEDFEAAQKALEAAIEANDDETAVTEARDLLQQIRNNQQQ